MRAKPGLTSTTRKIGISIAPIFAGGLLCGCFALFSLDGYGPPDDVTDASSSGDSSRDAADAAAVDAKTPGRTIFVTGGTFPGNLGGLQGGDAKCQAAAVDAGLDGSFKAWLSDNNANAADRIAARSAPLRLVNGALVATSAAELSTTGPRTGIVVDEHGKPAGGGGCDGGLPVWTATLPDGGATKPDCTTWNTNAPTITGLAGVAGGAGPLWTAACTRTCAQVAALYCIEQ